MISSGDFGKAGACVADLSLQGQFEMENVLEFLLIPNFLQDRRAVCDWVIGDRKKLQVGLPFVEPFA